MAHASVLLDASGWAKSGSCEQCARGHCQSDSCFGTCTGWFLLVVLLFLVGLLLVRLLVHLLMQPLVQLLHLLLLQAWLFLLFPSRLLLVESTRRWILRSLCCLDVNSIGRAILWCTALQIILARR